jgi:hypothetical protein
MAPGMLKDEIRDFATHLGAGAVGIFVQPHRATTHRNPRRMQSCSGSLFLPTRHGIGTRIIYAAVLTALPLDPDPPAREDSGTHGSLCVEGCPAFDREYTDERLFS